MKLTRLGFLTSLLGGFLGRNLKLFSTQPSVLQLDNYKILALEALARNSRVTYDMVYRDYEILPSRKGQTIKWYRPQNLG